MQERTTPMRKLAFVMGSNGAISQRESPGKVYRGSFGFLLLQIYIPYMPIADDSEVSGICTVSANLTDNFGETHTFEKDGTPIEYNMMYVGPTEIDGRIYLIYERPMPSDFTKIAGDLKLVFNYSLVNKIDQTTARQFTGEHTIPVQNGGDGGEILDTGISYEQAKKLNEFYDAAAKFTEDLKLYIELKKYIDDTISGMTLPPDCTDLDNVSTPDNPAKVEFVFDQITQLKKFKFSNLKGNQGEKGRDGEKGKDGEKGEKGDKGDDLYSFSLSEGNLILNKDNYASPNVNYNVNEFGNLILTLNL